MEAWKDFHVARTGYPWYTNMCSDVIGQVCGSGSGVEHRLAKAGVAGSNPVYRSRIGPIAQWSERPAHNRLVLGSSPSGPTTVFAWDSAVQSRRIQAWIRHDSNHAGVVQW